MTGNWRRLLCAALTVGIPAAAAQDGAAPQFFSAGYLAQVLLSLLLVLGLLLLAVYLLRRVNSYAATSGQPLRVLASHSVGTREKVVLLSAGGQQLLLGVAQGSVRTLHVFAEPVVSESPAGAPAGRDFQHILRAVNPLGGKRS